MIEDKFTFASEDVDGKTVLHLKGTIDEDATFEKIQEISGEIVFDFNQIDSINSCGVRNWVNLLKSLSDRPVYYENCPPAIVRQLNMIPSFKGHADVISVYVPYVCDETDEETTILVGKEKFANGNINVEEVLTTEINGEQKEVEIDGHPEQYFAFSK